MSDEHFDAILQLKDASSWDARQRGEIVEWLRLQATRILRGEGNSYDDNYHARHALYSVRPTKP